MATLKVVLLLSILIVPTITFAVSLDVKTGAWETTTTTSMGQASIPAATLAQMPPEMRKLMQVQIQAARKPYIDKSCITQEDLNQNRMLTAPESDSACTRKIISSSPNKMTMQRNCSAPRVSTSLITVEAISPVRTKGTIDISQPNAGKIHIDVSSRWLSSSCVGIPPRTDWNAKLAAARQQTPK